MCIIFVIGPISNLYKIWADLCFSELEKAFERAFQFEDTAPTSLNLYQPSHSRREPDRYIVQSCGSGFGDFCRIPSPFYFFMGGWVLVFSGRIISLKWGFEFEMQTQNWRNWNFELFRIRFLLKGRLNQLWILRNKIKKKEKFQELLLLTHLTFD